MVRVKEGLEQDRNACSLPRGEDVAGMAAAWYRWEGQSQCMFIRCTYSDHSFYIAILS